jgi:protein tyrosine/serine phosphatase
MRLHPTLRNLAFSVLGMGVCIGMYAAYLGMIDNFHEVVPGELYRSAQPNGEQIKHYAEAHGVRSILNLRGPSEGKPWYEEEVAASKEAGITHISFLMSSKTELPQEQVDALIEVMRNAPKPLLIHCHAGVNRTGLASALYLAALKDAPEAHAEIQLSPIYGYTPFWFSKNYPMQQTFDRIEPMFGYDG